MKTFIIIGFILSLINNGLTQIDQVKLFDFNEFYLKSVYEIIYENVTTAANITNECTESLKSLLATYGENPVGWPEKGDNNLKNNHKNLKSQIIKHSFYL
jgi:hypothetical protein